MRRIFSTVALLALPALVAALGATAAQAGEEENVRFKARLEPERLEPGADGHVLLDLEIRKSVHVYADKRLRVTSKSPETLTVGPVEVSGLKEWKDPNSKEPAEKVLMESGAVRVPVKLAPGAKLPAKVDLAVRYSACDEATCFPPTTITVSIEIPGADAPIAAPVPTSMPKDPVTAPVVATDAPAQVGLVEFRLRTEPATLAPGAKGALVVEVLVRKDAHVKVDGDFSVKAQARPGVTFGAVALEGVTKGWKPAGSLDDPQSVFLEKTGVARVPVEIAADASVPASFEVDVRFGACDDAAAICNQPETRRVALDVRAGGAPAAVVAATPPSPSPAAKKHDWLLAQRAERPGTPCAGILPAEIVRTMDADLEADDAPAEGEKGGSSGLVLLLTAFAFGVGLAFTPCVLPIIPITVSIIGGGGGTVSRGRMTVLLSFYVAGLALAFGTLGLLAAKAGASFSAAFQTPAAIWIIAGVFFVLSLGMYGIYELQPPAWLQKFQGSAKGGNVLGAFLFGALAAVIASPCTGPVIAGMVVYAAQEGNLFMGFLRFVALGLGMGAVFFAAGSLNLVMRPGPWMVWVRHAFGVILTGAALFYLANNELLAPTGVFVAGFAAAALIGFGIVRHLVKAQGQEMRPAAGQGAKVSVAIVLMTFLVAMLTRPSHELSWTVVKSRQDVLAEIEKAKAFGKPTVVDVWATWCHYCKEYDSVIEKDPVLLERFRKVHRVRLDVTNSNFNEIRSALRIPGSQPFMVFVDKDGSQRWELAIYRWFGEGAASELAKRLDCLEGPAGEAIAVPKPSN